MYFYSKSAGSNTRRAFLLFILNSQDVVGIVKKPSILPPFDKHWYNFPSKLMQCSLVRIALLSGGSARFLRGPLFAALLMNLAENGKIIILLPLSNPILPLIG